MLKEDYNISITGKQFYDEEAGEITFRTTGS